MNRFHLTSFIAVAALATAQALASDYDQPIEVNTDALPSHVAEQVRERAAQGQGALMQYLWFTRHVHHLWIDDVTKARPEPQEQDDEPVVKRQVVVIRTYGRD